MDPLVYRLALFFHILGAFGLIAALAIEAISLPGLRRALRAEDARPSLTGMRVNRIVGPLSVVLILVTGLYMTATSWGPQGWIVVALGTVVLVAVLGAFLTGTRMARIGPRIFEATGAIPAELAAMLQDPVLLVSARIRLALVIGVLFLMTVKPTFVPSLIAIAVAAVLGLLAGQLASRKSPRELRTQAD
jgi:hypothetical protein